jgi:hypothetical protein
MATREKLQTAGTDQSVEQQQPETSALLQDTAVSTTETQKYSLKDAEPLSGNMIIKVTNFDQPSTRYYYTPYPVDTSVLIYGEVISIEPKNEFRIEPGDRVLYNGSVVYQSIEEGAKYVVGPVKNVLLVWRSKSG